MTVPGKSEESLRVRILAAGVVGGVATAVALLLSPILSPVIGVIATCVVIGIVVGAGARVFLRRKFGWSLSPWATWLLKGPHRNPRGSDD
jgi:hypothetical protein